MPKRLSSREVLAVLRHEGFVFVSQKGSHAKYRKIKDGQKITVIVPMGKSEIPLGTLYAIIEQSKLPKAAFFT